MPPGASQAAMKATPAGKAMTIGAPPEPNYWIPPIEPGEPGYGLHLAEKGIRALGSGLREQVTPYEINVRGKPNLPIPGSERAIDLMGLLNFAPDLMAGLPGAAKALLTGGIKKAGVLALMPIRARNLAKTKEELGFSSFTGGAGPIGKPQPRSEVVHEFTAIVENPFGDVREFPFTLGFFDEAQKHAVIHENVGELQRIVDTIATQQGKNPKEMSLSEEMMLLDTYFAELQHSLGPSGLRRIAEHVRAYFPEIKTLQFEYPTRSGELPRFKPPWEMDIDEVRKGGRGRVTEDIFGAQLRKGMVVNMDKMFSPLGTPSKRSEYLSVGNISGYSGAGRQFSQETGEILTRGPLGTDIAHKPRVGPKRRGGY